MDQFQDGIYTVLTDEHRLLDLLTDLVVDFLADRFAVRRDWLIGRSEYVCTSRDTVYKQNSVFARHVVELSWRELRPTVYVVCSGERDLEAAYRSGDRSDAPYRHVALVVETEHTTTEGTPYKVYELWRAERWNYQRSRIGLKILFRFLDEATRASTISLYGRVVPAESLDRLRAGLVLPVEVIGPHAPHARSWDPRDYIDAEYGPDYETEEYSYVAQGYAEDHLARWLWDEPWMRWLRARAAIEQDETDARMRAIKLRNAEIERDGALLRGHTPAESAADAGAAAVETKDKETTR